MFFYSRLLRTVLVLTLCLAGISIAANSSDAKSTPTTKPLFDTPRKMFTVFRNIMDDVEFGDEKNIDTAFKAIYTPAGMLPEERETYRLYTTLKLHTILDNMQYVNEDIPVNVEGDSAVITLGKKGNKVDFHICKDKNGSWIFSQETIDDPKLEDYYKSIANRKKQLTDKDLAGDTFVPSMRSPSASTRTFLSGMYHRYGMNINDAVQVLDLSYMAPDLRESIGKTRAIQLMRILNRHHAINLSALSSDPQFPHPQVFLREPGVGSIVMNVVEDPKTGLKSWKFTQKTIQSLPELYRHFINKPVVEDAEPLDDYLSLDMQIEAYIRQKYPAALAYFKNIPFWKLIALIVIILFSLIVAYISSAILKLIFNLILKNATAQNDRMLGKAIVRPTRLLVFFWLTLAGCEIICLPVVYLEIIKDICMVVMIVTGTWLAFLSAGLLPYLLTGKMQRMNKDLLKEQNLFIPMTTKIFKIFILIYGLFKLAEQFGQDSTRVLAALGIGGVALALASKDTVENVFGSIMILIERPFRLGDSITSNSVEGIVEHVGMRSTRIRTYYNSLITIPNSQFIKSPVDNKGRRQYRRMKVNMSIALGTPADKIVAFTRGIEELILAKPLTRKDFFHVRLNNITSDGLVILLYIFFETQEFGVELKSREDLLLDILTLAKKLDIEIVYPTRTIYMRRGTDSQQPMADSQAKAIELGQTAAKDILAAFEVVDENISHIPYDDVDTDE